MVRCFQLFYYVGNYVPAKNKEETAMLTDVQIAQRAEMKPIREIAAGLGLTEDDLELYGKYKAKISMEAISRAKGNTDGKLVLVTAINPTPAGEGKTTTMRRLYRWRISISILPVISTRLPQRTI